VVSAVGAGELHASLNPGDGVETFHRIESSLFLRERKARGVSGEGNAAADSEMGTGKAGRLRIGAVCKEKQVPPLRRRWALRLRWE
jgi:hypothetical protein